MLERFKTTGRTTQFGPELNTTRCTTSSELPVTHADDGAEIASGAGTSTEPTVPISTEGFIDPSLIPSHNPTTGIFNPGVGGDSLRNVIYRLTGTSLNPSGLLGSLLALPSSHQPQYVFLLAGTNDLGDGRKPLPAASLSQYRLIVNALAHTFPQTKICVCGLMPKAKVKKPNVIEESNILLKGLVDSINETKLGSQTKVEFLPTDEKLGLEHLENDGVHLSSDGYEILSASMAAKLQAMGYVMPPSTE